MEFIFALLFGCALISVLGVGLDALLTELRKIRECLERREKQNG